MTLHRRARISHSSSSAVLTDVSSSTLLFFFILTARVAGLDKASNKV